jgi:hypothetical protein
MVTRISVDLVSKSTRVRRNDAGDVSTADLQKKNIIKVLYLVSHANFIHNNYYKRVGYFASTFNCSELSLISKGKFFTSFSISLPASNTGPYPCAANTFTGR